MPNMHLKGVVLDDALEVLSVMVHPYDKSQRDSFKIFIEASNLSQKGFSNINLSSSDLKMLINYDGGEKKVLKMNLDGLIVGELLLHCYTQDCGMNEALEHFKVKNLNKQKYLKQKGSGTVPTSESALWEIWTKYKASAHLWSAMFIYSYILEDSWSPECIYDFLGIAMFLRDFSLNHKPLNSKEPLITKDIMWSADIYNPVPDDFSIQLDISHDDS